MALALALRQYRLITAEKELLDKTLKSSITVLSELLSITNPIAFSSGLRIKNVVVRLAEQLHLPNLWQFEIAALMSQIGCVTLPRNVLNKFHAGEALDPEEDVMYRNHPLVGSRLLELIPRLEKVAAIIAHQLRPYSAFQEVPELDEDISLGAQILKFAIDFDLLLHRGGHRRIEALQRLQDDRASYNPELLKILPGLRLDEEHEKIVSVLVSGISVGMITEQDVIASNGVLIIPKGQEVTWALLQGLKNFSHQVEIQEPILVRVKQELGCG